MVKYSPTTEFWVEPLATLRRIQDEINRAFGDEATWGAEAEYPPMNVWHGEDGIIVKALVPGVPLDKLELTVHQNTLSIRGRRDADAREGEVSFHRRERQLGAFARTIALPHGVDPEQVQASADNGVLTIALPRPESEKPRRIHITRL
jgi:HSP20 family protein